MAQVNRNDILAKLDAERQRRREHVVAGKTSPFRTSPIAEWDKGDLVADSKPDASQSKLGTPEARELLVMKLLEERRKNAARLQQQLQQHQHTQEELGSGTFSTNELNTMEYGDELNVHGASDSSDPLFQVVNNHSYAQSHMEHDVDTEELDGVSNTPLFRPQPTSTSTSSQVQSQYPAQNLNYLKQHMHQSPATPQQADLDSFSSAFQKIQANVYGKTPTTIGEGRHINGGWRNTITFGNDLDEFEAQLNNMDKPPSITSSSHTLSRHSSSTSQPPSFTPRSNASSPRTKPPPSAQPPLFHRPSQPSPRTTQPRKATRPSSAPPRPNSATPPKRAPTPSKKSQVSFSGVTGKVARHGIERVENEVDREFQEKYTFAPNTSKEGKSGAEKVTMTKEKLELLSRSKKEALKKREAEKHAMEKEILDRMPFKPRITSLPPEYGNVKYQDDVPLVERLYHEADKKVAMRAKAKNDLMKEQLRNCSFKPKIGRPPSSLEAEPPRASAGTTAPQKPIYERLGDVQRQRREKLHNLKLQVEEEQKPTFTPKIVESKKQQIEVHSEGEGEMEQRAGENYEESHMTRSVNTETEARKSKRHQTPDTFSRLADLEIEQEKKTKKQEKWQKLLADQYTFAPQVNPNTEKILLESEYGSQLDFLDRLNYYKDKRKCAQMQYEPPSYTFQPYINPQTKDMVEQRLERNGEKEMDKYDRLAFGDKQKQAQAKQNLEAEYYSRYTFRPNIDKISSLIAPQRTVEELYKDEQKEVNKRAAKKAADDAFKAAYTFQPQLYSNPYNHVEPKHKVDIRNSGSISQGIKDMEERKALKIQKEKLAQQQKEMEHCTFTPVVNTPPPIPPEGPIVVRGLDRFLELKDLAKKLEDEKRERAENAFKVKPSAVGLPAGQPLQLPFTIPAPFHFHTRDRYAEEARQKKLERVNKEMRMNEERELTFQPRTNAKMKQILIEEILSR